MKAYAVTERIEKTPNHIRLILARELDVFLRISFPLRTASARVTSYEKANKHRQSILRKKNFNKKNKSNISYSMMTCETKNRYHNDV